MRYCKKCRILYSDQAAACPNCGAAAEPRTEEAPPPADKREVARDWIWIVVGIPLFIALVWFLVRLLLHI